MRIVKASADMKVHDFEFPYSTESLTVDKFSKMDVFRYNDPIQRNAVWDLDRKSLLIHTLLDGLPVPAALVEVIKKNGKKIRNVLDGKQRLTSIRDFIKNRYRLSNKTPYVKAFLFDEQGQEETVWVDVCDLTFEELPESFRDKIKSSTLHLVEVEIENEEQKREIFIRWNNGRPLNPQQSMKAYMSWEFLSYLNQIKDKDIFTFSLSERQIINDENAKLALQCLRILHTDGDTALSSQVLKQFVENRENEGEDLQQELNSAVDYVEISLQLIDKEQRKSILNQSRIQALIIASREAIKHNISHEDFAKWIVFFLDADYNNHSFRSYAGRNTTKRESVRERISIALNHFHTHCLKVAQKAY